MGFFSKSSDGEDEVEQVTDSAIDSTEELADEAVSGESVCSVCTEDKKCENCSPSETDSASTCEVCTADKVCDICKV